MTENQRTFEANSSLLHGLRIEPRPASEVSLPEECLPVQKASNAMAVGVSAPIPPELILRLIRRLKES